jgi:Protein ENHANCED DISEASE RESISTANCE 2, C-terminal
MLKTNNGAVITGKPTAGETFPNFDVGKSSGTEGVTPDTWSKCEPSSFNLRVGPDYSKHKRKEPSLGSLLEIVGVEWVNMIYNSSIDVFIAAPHLTIVPFFNSVFQCDKRVDCVGSKVNFPSGWKDMETNKSDVPPLFIVNFQIPSEYPTTIFREITDGPGWSLVLYFRMSQVWYEKDGGDV